MNDPKILYYKDENIRNQIDTLLHENAKLESSLGRDSTKKEFAAIKIKQKELFEHIRKLDVEFYNIIVIENDRG